MPAWHKSLAQSMERRGCIDGRWKVVFKYLNPPDICITIYVCIDLQYEDIHTHTKKMLILYAYIIHTCTVFFTCNVFGSCPQPETATMQLYVCNLLQCRNSHDVSDACDEGIHSQHVSEHACCGCVMPNKTCIYNCIYIYTYVICFNNIVTYFEGIHVFAAFALVILSTFGVHQQGLLMGGAGNLLWRNRRELAEARSRPWWGSADNCSSKR